MSVPAECDFFCLHAGRVSVFSDTCGTIEESFARDCECSESPVKVNPTCLQTVCTPQQFDALVAAEVARCGPGVAPNATAELSPAAVTVWRRSLPEQTVLAANPASAGAGGIHAGCAGGLASPFVFVPVLLALFGVVASVCAYKRRRVGQGRVVLPGGGYEVLEAGEGKF